MLKTICNNSLCCEPILKRMPDGNLIVVCGFGGGKEPDPDNYVGCIISNDNGATWSNIRRISSNLDSACAISDFYIYKGELRVIAHYHNGFFHDWKVRVIYSNDCGKTWAERETIKGLDTYCCLRGNIEANGKLIVPYQKYADTYEVDKETPIYKTKGIVEQGVIISDDGVNFSRYKIADFSQEDGWLWTEATTGRYKDELIMLIRMDRAGYLYETRSKDFGITWSTPIKSNIPNPGNKAKLINIDNDTLILLNTPNNGIKLDDRNPMSVWISDDGLKTFRYQEALMESNGRQAYPDGIYEDGTLLFTFDYNRHEIIYVKMEVK